MNAQSSREKSRARKRESERYLATYKSTISARTAEDAITESLRMTENMPDIIDSQGRRTVLATEEEIEKTRSYVTPNFIQKLLAQNKKPEKVFPIPLLLTHRKFLREKLQNPKTHGIPIAHPGGHLADLLFRFQRVKFPCH